ncbi:hypothetical protein Patl1_24591 [Pistacia atlantica]|uniref:Uncharacterized protein n=1 Tax=Pistacia atlantica TaxID=434234 RepID=A0ACC0ZYZ5_9ROSI|nr:hypothetical protein Patl1_24591 [Pistacia atlantica]
MARRKSAFIVDQNWVMTYYINDPSVLRTKEYRTAASAVLEYGIWECVQNSPAFYSDGSCY